MGRKTLFRIRRDLIFLASSVDLYNSPPGTKLSINNARFGIRPKKVRILNKAIERG